MFLAATPKQNQAPTAAFDPTCTGLYCSFDAGSSNDPDGSIVKYDWTFGDGSSDSTTSTTDSHTYASANTYTVTLTVTDNQGATSSVSHNVTVSVPTSNIGYVGGAAAPAATSSQDSDDPAVGDRREHRVALLDVQHGRHVVGPDRRHRLEPGRDVCEQLADHDGLQQDADGFRPRFERHVHDECGSPRRSSGGGVLGGESVQPGGPGHAGARYEQRLAHDACGTSGAGDWVVSFWADRSTATRTYNLPSGVVSRASSTDSGTLTDQAVIADSGAPVAGPTGNLTATTDAATNRSIAWTLILNSQ